MQGKPGRQSTRHWVGLHQGGNYMFPFVVFASRMSRRWPESGSGHWPHGQSESWQIVSALP